MMPAGLSRQMDLDMDTHHITNDTDANCSDLFNFSPLCVFKWLLDMHRLCSNDTDEPARIWILTAWLGQRRRNGSRRHRSALGGGTRLLPVLVSVKIISPPLYVPQSSDHKLLLRLHCCVHTECTCHQSWHLLIYTLSRNDDWCLDSHANCDNL